MRNAAEHDCVDPSRQRVLRCTSVLDVALRYLKQLCGLFFVVVLPCWLPLTSLLDV